VQGGGENGGHDRRPRASELHKRILSSLVLVPAAGLLIATGGLVFEAGILAIAILMAWEWGKLLAPERHRTTVRAFIAVAAVSTVLMVHLVGLAFAVIWAAVIPFLSIVVSHQIKLRAPVWLGAAVTGTVFPVLSLLWMRNHLDFGLETVVYVVASVVLTDIGAYAAGRSIGGPKLAPKVSPSKTWAGLAGGIAGALAVAAVFAEFHEQARLLALAPLAFAIALVAQAGDLIESAAKRRFKVKDSGTLIPGHGGILDRVDGQVTVIPVIALAMAVTGRSVLQW
jgi:phosphatidate cytidylyltransferase